MDGYDEIRVQVDRRGMALGATVIHDVGGVNESVRPIGTGPFDDVDDAVAACKPYLTIQQTLW